MDVKDGIFVNCKPKIKISLLFPRLVLTNLNISFSLLLLRTQDLIFVILELNINFKSHSITTLKSFLGISMIFSWPCPMPCPMFEECVKGSL